MKFMVVYFFAGHDDESAQIDIVNYKDKKAVKKHIVVVNIKF